MTINYMKQINLYFLFLLLSVFAGCKKDDDDDDRTGDWIRKSDFGGVPRTGAFVFTIGDNAYVGTGYDGDVHLSDVWMYDGNKNTWVRKAIFPGAARSNAVAFTINGKGYVGTGYDGDVGLKDFWEYSPDTDSWRQIADLPIVSGRYGAVAFTLNNFGYVGTGKDNDDKDQPDFYKYDPSTNQWNIITSIGIKRSGAFAFVVDGKAYVGGGINNGQYTPEFYEYNAADDTWIEKRDLNRADDDDNDDDNDDDDYNLQRQYSMTFVIGNDAYITGGSSGYILNDTWKYNTATDIWTEVDAFEGSSRQYAVAFTVKGKGFVTTGSNGSLRFDDNWMFDPTLSDDED